MKKIISTLLAMSCFAGCAVVGSAAASRTDFTIPVKEDTYVLNKNGDGDMSDKSFGGETELNLKSNEGTLTRYSFVKFDISALAGDNDFTCVDLDLYLTFRQNDPDTPENAVVEAYGFTNDWSENTLTFNNRPEAGELAGVCREVKNQKGINSISVTDYVRQALGRGETEVSFYLKDSTPEKPMHIKYSTKEGGAANAPKLSVYYGTKVDNVTLAELNAPKLPETPEVIPEVAPEVSKDGLDAIVGQKKSTAVTIAVSEDTYIEGGNSEDTNFGGSDTIDFKARANETTTALYRLPLLKFDISDFKDKNINSATLTLNCTLMENKDIPTKVHVYGCNPQQWDEMTVTFANAPEKEELVATNVVYSTGEVSFDVTDYLKTCQKYGDIEISFMLEGDADSVRRLYFSSKESANGGALLNLTYGDAAYSTYVKYEGENPWQVAMENYADWVHRWEVIRQGGDTDVDTVEKIAEEYPLITDATYGSETDGYNTRYRQFETRLISSLGGYTANTAETALYDEYGGYTGGERYEATGYFYTKKIGNRWWTIDPLGYPFYRVACVTVSHGSPLQKQNLLSKYGSLGGWAQATTDRFFELGFNSLGGWSDIENLSAVEQPLSQTKILYVLRSYASGLGLNVGLAGHTEFVGNVMPVFDPAFAESAKKTVKDGVKDHVGAPYVYGWMSDNELPCDLIMLDNTLKLDPTDERFIYSYANAWTFMYMKTGKKDVSLNDVTDELRLEYRAMVYDKYFNIVADALERYAGMHQFVGCRFITSCFKDEYVMRVAGYYCDVITLNYYSVWQADPTLMANMQKWAGKPFAVTEWYAKGMDVWEKDNRFINVSGAGWTVRTQADRGRFYQNFTLQLLECKGCVGFDWFQYLDNDPENLAADLSNRDSNKGMYSGTFEEYTGLTDYMKELNHQKYNLIKFFDER